MSGWESPFRFSNVGGRGIFILAGEVIDLLFSVTALLCVQNELEMGLVSNFLKELVELCLFSFPNVCNKTQGMILLI